MQFNIQNEKNDKSSLSPKSNDGSFMYGDSLSSIRKSLDLQPKPIHGGGTSSYRQKRNGSPPSNMQQRQTTIEVEEKKVEPIQLHPAPEPQPLPNLISRIQNLEVAVHGSEMNLKNLHSAFKLQQSFQDAWEDQLNEIKQINESWMLEVERKMDNKLNQMIGETQVKMECDVRRQIESVVKYTRSFASKLQADLRQQIKTEMQTLHSTINVEVTKGGQAAFSPEANDSSYEEIRKQFSQVEANILTQNQLALQSV